MKDDNLCRSKIIFINEPTQVILNDLARDWSKMHDKLLGYGLPADPEVLSSLRHRMDKPCVDAAWFLPGSGYEPDANKYATILHPKEMFDAVGEHRHNEDHLLGLLMTGARTDKRTMALWLHRWAQGDMKDWWQLWMRYHNTPLGMLDHVNHAPDQEPLDLTKMTEEIRMGILYRVDPREYERQRKAKRKAEEGNEYISTEDEKEDEEEEEEE